MKEFRYILTVIAALVVIVLAAGSFQMARSAIPTEKIETLPLIQPRSCFMALAEQAVVMDGDGNVLWAGDATYRYSTPFPCPRG